MYRMGKDSAGTVSIDMLGLNPFSNSISNSPDLPCFFLPSTHPLGLSSKL